MPEHTHLQVRGSLSEGMTYRPKPGRETTAPGPARPGNPEYQLVLLDGEDHVLLSADPQVTPWGCGSLGDPVTFRVRGTLQLLPTATAYELRRGSTVLHRAAIDAPVPPLTETSLDLTPTNLTASWAATDRPGATYNVVVVMDTGRRFVLARDLTEPTRTVDLSGLPEAGAATIRIEASDGVRSSDVELGVINVAARPPQPVILSPETGARIPYGTPLSVVGCCLDMAGRPCEPGPIVWSLDGRTLSTGNPLTSIDSPTPGPHQLVLTYGSGPQMVQTSTGFDIETSDDAYRDWQRMVGAATEE